METLYEASESVKPETEAQETEEDGINEEAIADEVITDDTPTVDYEALIASDIEELKAEFPELRGIADITELNNPLRYAALRDLGLSPAESYMATAARRSQDTRAHLKSAHGRSAAISAGMMSQLELATARELFPGLNDSELQRLYKRVMR